MFGEKELLDLTVKELRVELGKYNLLKNGRKAELQRRLRAALEKMAVSHCRLAVCSCELPRFHRERQRGKKPVKKGMVQCPPCFPLHCSYPSVVQSIILYPRLFQRRT